MRITYTGSGSHGRRRRDRRDGGRNEVFLGQFEVVVDPELAAQAIAERKALAEQLLLLPVRLRKVLGALEDVARAGSALPHAAAVLEVRIRELLDARPHHEVGAFLDFALVVLAVRVDDNLWHLCIQTTVD